MKTKLSLLFVTALLVITGCGSKVISTTGGSNMTKQWSTPPAVTIDASKKYTATFDTSLGTFKVELLASESPKTVNNFVFLARQGFYDGTIFHRIIKSFMIQGGDPTGTGMGGPGYNIPDELPVKHPYAPGIVAMANTGRPNSGGSQFFICTGADSKSLDRMPSYTEFGLVSEGMDVVQKIASVQVMASNGETSKPVVPPVINKITISEA
jgi:cyclophilin family peptidyl-prolyl cis-trans isomerase